MVWAKGQRAFYNNSAFIVVNCEPSISSQTVYIPSEIPKLKWADPLISEMRKFGSGATVSLFHHPVLWLLLCVCLGQLTRAGPLEAFPGKNPTKTLQGVDKFCGLRNCNVVNQQSQNKRHTGDNRPSFPSKERCHEAIVSGQPRADHAVFYSTLSEWETGNAVVWSRTRGLQDVSEACLGYSNVIQLFNRNIC